MGELDERLDEVEECGCRPVHVLENEEQRALPREAGQQPARGERGVLGVSGSRREPDGDGELIGQVRGVLGPQPAAKPRRGLAVGELGQQAAKRLVRGVAPVGSAVRDGHVRHAL